MNKALSRSTLVGALGLAGLIALGGSASFVAAAPPSAPSGNGGGSSSSSSSYSYTGATELKSDTTEDGKTYSSTTAAQNALLVSGGTATITNPTVTKSGDSSDENADFSGVNAAVLAYNGATLNLTGGSVETSGSHANGVFAYGTGTINIENTKIKTTSNNSGGIMVTGGGTMNAKNLTVETAGGSSAAIRSDRGGGTQNVDGGTYTANGVGSPAIYSTANVNVANATLNSTASEGAVIEGLNSITLNNTILNDNNTKLNGNSETYKNIFIYQSMSGDAEEGTGTFTAKNATLAEAHGDNIFVTNTSATINLENSKFENTTSDFVFLRAQSGKWGNSGSNGGAVSLNATNQNIKGDFAIDSVSTLALKLTSGSYLLGAIDSENTAKKATLELDDDSVFVLTSDSYVDSISDSKAVSENIYGNGHTLYVNGSVVTTNTGTPPEMDESDDGANLETSADISEIATTATPEATETEEATNDNLLWIILGSLGGAVVLAVIIAAIVSKKGKGGGQDQGLSNNGDQGSAPEITTPEPPAQA